MVVVGDAGAAVAVAAADGSVGVHPVSPIGSSKTHVASDQVAARFLGVFEALTIFSMSIPQRARSYRGVDSNRPDLSIVDGFGVVSFRAFGQQEDH